MLLMLQLTDYSFIVGAAFNAVWDPALDRTHATYSGEQSLATDALRCWAINLGLTDIWRLNNPSIKVLLFSPAGINLSAEQIFFSLHPSVFTLSIQQFCFRWLYPTIQYYLALTCVKPDPFSCKSLKQILLGWILFCNIILQNKQHSNVHWSRKKSTS